MRQPLTAIAIALPAGILFGIVLIVLGAPKLPMLIAGEVTFVVLFSLLYWKPAVILDALGKLMKRVRRST